MIIKHKTLEMKSHLPSVKVKTAHVIYQFSRLEYIDKLVRCYVSFRKDANESFKNADLARYWVYLIIISLNLYRLKTSTFTTYVGWIMD